MIDLLPYQTASRLFTAGQNVLSNYLNVVTSCIEQTEDISLNYLRGDH